MKKIFIFSLVMLISFSAFSQTETIVELEGKRGPYVTNRLFDNIFVSVGGGAQMYLGAYGARAHFGNRISPALDISIGKWVTPSVGLRIQYSGLSAKTMDFGKGVYSKEQYYGGAFYKAKFNTMNLHTDVLWNVSNAIGGYRADRFWSFVPFAGFGWARSSGNGTHKNEIAGTFGLLNNMRIIDALSVNLEAKAMLVNQRFAYTSGNKGVNALVSLTVGITYNFCNRYFKRASDLVVVTDNSGYINTINDLESQLAAAQAKRDALQKELAAERAKEAKIVKEMYPVLPDMAFFFNINSAKLSDKEMINIESIAKVLKQVPDKKYVLYASADKETGTAAYNEQLSKKRGEAVYNALIKAGVNPDQVRIEAVGSSVQKFKGAQLNRVVVIEDK